MRSVAAVLSLGLALIAPAVVSAAPASASASAWPLPFYEAKPKDVVAAADRVLAASKLTAGAERAFLFEEVIYRFEADGTRTRRTRFVERVLTAAGIDVASSLAVEWQPWYQDRPILRVRVLGPDGSVRVLDPKTIEVSGGSNERQTYSDRARLRAPLPGIVVGAILEIELVERDHKAPFGGGRIDDHFFGAEVPILDTRVVLDTPATLPIRTVHHSGRGRGKLVKRRPLVAVVDGRRTETYVVESLPARAPREPGMPLDEGFEYLVFSTGTSWSEAAATYAKIVDEVLAKSDLTLIKQRALEITAKTRDPREKIVALTKWVHDSARYTAVELGRAAIVPVAPEEVLRRGFGDCKDKALLLVALLRSIGIQADVALLSAGMGNDVEPTLPSLGAFNHAIVRVAGKQPLWIDATAQFTPVGELPVGDLGRAALVASAETTGLEKTPGPVGRNRLKEVREIRMIANESAKIVETVEYEGVVAHYFREQLANENGETRRQRLGRYVKEQYEGTLAKENASDASDLTTPLRTRIEVDNAACCVTGEQTAQLDLRYGMLFGELPHTLWDREQPERKRDYVQVLPVEYDVEYRVEPPLGYSARRIPPSRTIPLGPAAQLIIKSATKPNGVVSVAMRIEISKARLSAAEVMALRSAAFDLAPDLCRIELVSVGAEHLAAMRLRPAFEEYTRLTKLHPKVALFHTQLARIYMEAGLVTPARQAAERAIALDPRDAWAHMVLGMVMAHDASGRYAPWRPEAAEAERIYRRSKDLDPNFSQTRLNLIDLLSYGRDGELYGEGARLKDALAEAQSYSQKIQRDKPSDPELHLLVELKRWSELEGRARLAPQSDERDADLLLALVMNRGVAAALAEAETMGQARVDKIGLLVVGRLMTLHQYTQTIALMERWSGSSQAKTWRPMLEVLRAKVARLASEKKKSPPVAVVQQLVEAHLANGGSTVYAKLATDELLQTVPVSQLYHLWPAAFRLPLPPSETAHLFAEIVSMDFVYEVYGDDTSGYRVKLASRAHPADKMWFGVVRERDGYRIAASSGMPASFGGLILGLAMRNQHEKAKQWVQWAFDELDWNAGDDSMTQSPFFRIWFRYRGDPTPERVRFAAAALAAEWSRKVAALAIPVLEKTPEDLDVELKRRALIPALLVTGRAEAALAAIGPLIKAHPESAMLHHWHLLALRRLGRWDEHRRETATLQKEAPKHPVVLDAKLEEARHDEKYDDVDRHQRELLETLDTPSQQNEVAWNAVVTGKDAAEADRLIEKAIETTRHRVPAYLHTRAAILAEQGELVRARQLLHEQMTLLGTTTPSACDDYVLGRIADRLGAVEEARRLYGLAIAHDTEATRGTCRRVAQRHLESAGNANLPPRANDSNDQLAGR